jgi:MOSC domain-containing protein YiiM
MAHGRIVSVNVGRPKAVEWQGRLVKTGIYKAPVLGRVAVRTLGLDGDGQADPRFHGGPLKAVYAYPNEHYAPWSHELRRSDLSWGAFGENLTTEGLVETEVRIGDRLEAGTALLEVTMPRFPCFKLGNKFGTPAFVKQFAQSGRCGFYLSVVREGEVGAGDAIRVAARAETGPTVSRAFAESLEGEEGA